MSLPHLTTLGYPKPLSSLPGFTKLGNVILCLPRTSFPHLSSFCQFKEDDKTKMTILCQVGWDALIYQRTSKRCGLLSANVYHLLPSSLTSLQWAIAYLASLLPPSLTSLNFKNSYFFLFVIIANGVHKVFVKKKPSFNFFAVQYGF